MQNLFFTSDLFVTSVKRFFYTLFLLAGFASFNAANAQESTTQYIDDAAATAKIKAALVADREIDGLNINVATSKGIVQLSGYANNQQEVDRAINIARALSPTQTVQNDIRLKVPDTAPTAPTVSP